LESGKRIWDDWRDGDSKVYTIALSPGRKKVVSGSDDGAVKLWDIDTRKVIEKMDRSYKKLVISLCWSRDGRRVVNGFEDGTARQWDVELENEETILASIEIGHTEVRAAVYSPDTTLINLRLMDPMSPRSLVDTQLG
jgi:WD40 repeat protein